MNSIGQLDNAEDALPLGLGVYTLEQLTDAIAVAAKSALENLIIFSSEIIDQADLTAK